MDDVRERTFSWLQPMVDPKVLGTMTGLEFLRSLNSRTSAPIAQCLDFTLADLGEGKAAFEMQPAEFHYNPMGTVHGGVMSTLLDSAMGCAVHTTLAAGEAYTSLDISIRFVKQLTTDVKLVRAEGTVITRGRRLATAEARLVDENGTVYALGTSSCMIMSLPL